MTQDEIIEMAKQAWISEQEAQLITEFDMAYISCTYLTDLVAFAKLVEERTAAKEREACAKLCESLFDPQDDTCDEAEQCAKAIRSRGETTLRGEA